MIDIKSVDYKSLETEHASLETELNLAKRELSVAEELYKDNMYSEKEYLEIKGK